MSADRLPEDQLAAGPLDDSDAAVLLAVRELHSRVDPVPGGLAERIKFELTLAALHAEVAELQQLTLAGVRDDTAPFTPTESVTFTSSTLSLMVSVSPAGEGARAGMARIDGWVTGGPATVEVRVGERTVTVDVDEHGRFALDEVPRGSVRFILRPAGGGRPVITPAVEI